MYDTVTELLQDVLRRAGESPTDTAGDFYTAAQRAVDRIHNELLNFHPFLWSRQYPPGVIRTVDDLTTGTVNVQNGSTAITFSSAPAASVANREIVITGFNEVYRIASHVAGAAAATLDSAYNGTTATAASYTVFQRDYTLATDVNHLESLVVSDGGIVIPQRDEAWLREHRPDPPSAQWPPEYFARIDQDRIRLFGYPDRTRRLEYLYTIAQQDDLSGAATLLVPREWRHVLADGAVYLVELARNDDRADAAGILYAAGREQMVAADMRSRRLLGTAHAGTRRGGDYA